jgi:hypothetical protein
METDNFSAGCSDIESGEQFDRAVVDIFLENIDEILKNKAEVDTAEDACLSDFTHSKK